MRCSTHCPSIVSADAARSCASSPSIFGPDGGFVEVEIEPTTAALGERLQVEGVELVDGQTAEIALGVDAWLADAAAPLRSGLVILIDYGAAAVDLYDPARRPDGTLQAYVRHRISDDPYRSVGRQDLTAHVDVSRSSAQRRRRGCRRSGSRPRPRR